MATKKKVRTPSKSDNGISKNAQALLKLLMKEDLSFTQVSALFEISKDKVADLSDELCKIGYDVRAYPKDGDNHLTLARDEESSLEALPIPLTNRKIKIAFFSELRMGALQSQTSMAHWLYKMCEHESIDFAVFAGGMTIGMPALTNKPDLFKVDPKNPRVLTEYVTKHFPRSKTFKTYIIANRRELAAKTKAGVNLLNLVAQRRDDLAFAGDLQKTFDVRGVRIKVMCPWDDNSPKGLSYGLQKIVDGISDNPAPHIIVAGGMHERVEISDYGKHGIHVFGVPSLHTQMARQYTKGVRPRLGCLILELEFGKDWTFDASTGLRADWRNLDDYVRKDDCYKGVEDFDMSKVPASSRPVLEWFINEQIISEGELSRRLNKPKSFVRQLVQELEKSADVKIPLQIGSKRYEFQEIEKTHFRPLAAKFEDVFQLRTKSAGMACTHYGSHHDLPHVVQQAFQDAAAAGVRRVYHAGDVTEGPGASGYRGHQNDVQFPDTDGLEDYAVSKWPRVTIKVDPKWPLVISRMKLNEKGQPTYEEVVIKSGEAPLQTDIIDGNHDCWAKMAIGHRPVRTLALRMPELLRYLGPNDGKISMDGAIVYDGIYNRLTHGDGGLGYAISGKLQNHVASHRRRGASKGRPTVLWVGNWHINCVLFQDELSVMLACFKSEDEFHLRKGLVSWVGMNIFEVYTDKENRLTRVVSDYRNYRHLAIVNS